MRIAHISDIHLSRISLHIRDLFSKRILGTCNLLLKRKRTFQEKYLDELLPLFKSLKIDTLLVTGDLTSTSLDEEFLLAQNFLQQLQKNNIRLFLLPGNHDMYTKEAFRKKSFYQFFEGLCDLSALSKEGVSCFPLDEQWSIVCLDCCRATSLLSSRGHFSKEIEDRLDHLLSTLRSQFVILALHFPISGQISRRKMLERSDFLKKILHKYPQVKIYLYGHTHKPCIEDLRYQHLPVAIGAGSVTKKNIACLHLLEINPSGCIATIFQRESKGWKKQNQNQFFF
jgi:3',5'-cyclic AMP phosphodiesterase CpdA